MAWPESERDSVVQMLAVTCELTGTELSDPAKELLLRTLGAYPAAAVVAALERCATECKFKLTLADILARIDDGRLGPDEAWALFPKSEEAAAVVTDEMAAAWGAAEPLFKLGDQVAAHLAFKETYQRCVREARAGGKPVHWFVSAGWDRALTESVAIEGLKRGLISKAMALQFIEPSKHEQALIAAGRAPLSLPESTGA